MAHMAKIRCEATLFWLRAAIKVGLWMIIRPGWQWAKNTSPRGFLVRYLNQRRNVLREIRTVDEITNEVCLEAGGSHKRVRCPLGV